MKYVAAFVALLALQTASAAEFSGYLTLTSDYIKRGVSQSDSDAAVQLGVDVSFDAGFFAGAWGSSIDMDNGPTRQRDREVNLYAGYAYDVSDTWRITANLVSYQYPGQTGNVDYDYLEYSLITNFDDRIWLEYSYSPDLYNTLRSTQNLELYTEYALSENWSLGGGAGYYDVSELSGVGYGYWQLGLSRSLRFADIDFRYHDTNRAVHIISTDSLARARLAVTLTVPF